MSVEQTPEKGQAASVGSDDLVRRLRDHAQKLAGQLAECAGILAAVNIDRRHRDMHGNLFINQTLDWGKGAVAIAAKANALLEEHDSLDLDAFLAECGAHIAGIQPPPNNGLGSTQLSFRKDQ